MVEYLWCFLLGRAMAAFGMGFYFPAASRIIEECSPPQYLSIFFTIYIFGVSLGRPILALVSLILPPFDDKHPLPP
jgi:MFS family permease